MSHKIIQEELAFRYEESVTVGDWGALSLPGSCPAGFDATAGLRW
jgi:hypothetical protein